MTSLLAYTKFGYLGPPVVLFLTNFLGVLGSPTKIDYRKRGTLILTSLLDRWQGFTLSKN